MPSHRLTFPVKVLLLGLASSASLIACLSHRVVGPVLPELPTEQAKCRVAASHASPLVTEWPASEKAHLESLLRGGGLAVAYSGCTMRILPQCRLRGRYTWQRTTPATDQLEINNEDELYAKLPLGAASLEGELKRAGKLSVQTVVSGQMRLEELSPQDVPNEGECARATHVIGALSVGAFTLSRGGSAEAKAGAEVTAVGQLGGHVARSATLVRAAGDLKSCNDSTDAAPHSNCRSPVQVFLWPIPGRGAEEGPPGTVRTDFVSAEANSRWDVYVDDQVVCTTPCSKWVSPERPILLRSRDDSLFRRPDRVQVLGLGEAAASGAVQLVAHPTSYGALATGIVFTSLGGLGVMTGVTLTSIGCIAGKSDGMCTGGMVSLGVGALVTAGAIWLMLEALPRADIAPRLRAAALRWGPGFLSASF